MKTETVEQPKYTSEEQAQFMDMLHELEVGFGYNRSRVARECNFSPAIITAVGKGERKPRYALEKMKQLYQQLTGKAGAVPTGSSPKRDLVYEALSELRHRDKAAYEQVEGMIKLLYKRIRGRHRHIPMPEEAPSSEGTKSNVDRVAEAGARKAVADIRQMRPSARAARKARS